MVSYINRIVDIFLKNKYLKILLFILFAIILLLFITTICVIVDNPKNYISILAPVMIAISALLASTVAMINLRTNFINKSIDGNKKDISEIHYLMLNLHMIIKKIGVYKDVVYSTKPTTSFDLLEYKKMFQIYANFFTNKTLMYYASIYEEKDTFDILQNIEKTLFFISTYNEEMLIYLNQFEQNILNTLPERNYIKKHVDELMQYSDELDSILKNISKNIFNEQSFLAKEENY